MATQSCVLPYSCRSGVRRPAKQESACTSWHPSRSRNSERILNKVDHRQRAVLRTNVGLGNFGDFFPEFLRSRIVEGEGRQPPVHDLFPRGKFGNLNPAKGVVPFGVLGSCCAAGTSSVFQVISSE